MEARDGERTLEIYVLGDGMAYRSQINDIEETESIEFEGEKIENVVPFAWIGADLEDRAEVNQGIVQGLANQNLTYKIHYRAKLEHDGEFDDKYIPV